MEVSWGILLIILGTALVTFLPRVIPLMVLSRFELPEWAARWLSFVPTSVMAALVGQEIFMNDGEWLLSFRNLDFIAAIPTFFIALKTRSLLATVLSGIITMMLLRVFF
ncbi:AzlD domain-containing protein [Neobacillus muris]|uniref:AzlD domain-containing protein n=1 Tax=Neobacillus muris TaxID=2941334 RepID=UPI00203D0E5B|nr:AzlD domain-containing protein [Neobacillus muris]